MCVAGGLTWYDSMLLPAPEVLSQPTVAHLDLVGYAEATAGPDALVHSLQIACGKIRTEQRRKERKRLK